MSFVAKMRNALADMIRLGRVTKVDNASKLQKVTVDVRVGVIDSNVARVQNYGFTATPDTADELLAVEITCNGNRFVVALDDMTNRPVGGEAGDVRVYHREGHFIHLTKDRLINVESDTLNVNVLETTWTGNITHTGNLAREGDVTHVGDTDQTGTHVASVDVIAGPASISLIGHTHDYHPGPGSLTPSEPPNP